jgi:hypothetical protein
MRQHTLLLYNIITLRSNYFTLEWSFLTPSLQRNSIAIPQEAWASFAEVIQDYTQKMS